MGPTVGGFLVNAYGFAWTTVIFFFLYCLMIFFNLAEVSHDVIIKNNCYKEYRKYRLLENNNGNILGVCTEQEDDVS